MYNVLCFIQGWVRYYLVKYVPFLVRRHIREQIAWREKQAHPFCKNQGQCICGCAIPQLHYADKRCGVGDIFCYPKMMNKNEWRKFMESTGGAYKRQGGLSDDMFI